jgi:hypothetical protein
VAVSRLRMKCTIPRARKAVSRSVGRESAEVAKWSRAITRSMHGGPLSWSTLFPLVWIFNLIG